MSNIIITKTHNTKLNQSRFLAGQVGNYVCSLKKQSKLDHFVEIDKAAGLLYIAQIVRVIPESPKPSSNPRRKNPRRVSFILQNDQRRIYTLEALAKIEDPVAEYVKKIINERRADRRYLWNVVTKL